MRERNYLAAAPRRKSLHGSSSKRLEAEPVDETTGSASQSATDIAIYIAQMTAELGLMASSAKLDVLAYLLAIARTEAERSAGRKAFNPQLPIKLD
ncbi:MAG: hypothetical protein EBY21_07905 [Alphaproteobacteria bacterium]|nr:hypothetical protein [Alphaproteobacteria bacterium]